MRAAAWALALVSLAAALDPAAAQCDGKIVSAISVVPRDPSFLRFPRALRPLARGVGLHHTTTKPDVILGFLLLQVGRPCTEQQRSESERILRFQPFLADATVRAVPDTAGAVRIEVETSDEIPTVFSMRFRDGRPAALRIGNGNVGGRGVSLAVRGEQGFAYRDGVGVQFVAYQAFGRPYTLAVVADRTPLGSSASVDFGHAFITDLQRSAWHVGFRDMRGYTSFVRPSPDSVSLALGARRRFADLGGVFRIGVQGRSAFVGGLVTAERVTPASQAVIVSDSGLVPDSSPPLAGPFAHVNSTRLNAVVGVRSVVFLPVRGFDALAGAQDVAKGIQLGVVAGRGMSWFGARDHDLFLAADFYAGVGSATSFAALRLESEGLRHSGGWHAIVASGRLAWNCTPSRAENHTGGAEFPGGWGCLDRFPLQLRLGDRQGGVRGYSGSRVAGAMRAVGRFEARRYLGQVTRHLGLGLSSFADAGRVWAGDAPFGVDSRIKVGVGAGLLAAIPPHSRQLWRLDFAYPVSPDAHARWELRLTALRTRAFWREPNDVSRARTGAAPSTIFTWP
jgi:hypothetical protein